MLYFASDILKTNTVYQNINIHMNFGHILGFANKENKFFNENLPRSPG